MATPIPDNQAEFRLADVIKVCDGEANHPAQALLAAKPDASVQGVGTDTRADLRGKLFVALHGERFDAHHYAAQAMAAGAACLLVERVVDEHPAIVVDSTLHALGQLAQFHRRRWGKSVVAVAGSAGKTTTRSLIAALLEQELPGRVLTTSGNLNNRVGVPMVLLGLLPEHEIAVVEIGTNTQGEVAAIAALTEPDLGVLTLIDLEHTEGLGSLDDIEQEEAALLSHVRRSHVRRSQIRCRAVGNGDDPRVLRQLRQRPELQPICYGYQTHNDYQIEGATIELDEVGAIRTSVRVQKRGAAAASAAKAVGFSTPFLGRPGVLASTAALAVAEQLLGRSPNKQRLEQAFFQPGARQTGRLQPHRLTDGTLLIDDSYNANPASVIAGLEVAFELATLRKCRLHAVLGEMRELGAVSEEQHRLIGERLPEFGLASLTAIGGDAEQFITEGQSNVHFVERAEAVFPTLSGQVQPGDVVFVKASRGIAAERVINDFRKAGSEKASSESGTA